MKAKIIMILENGTRYETGGFQEFRHHHDAHHGGDCIAVFEGSLDGGWFNIKGEAIPISLHEWNEHQFRRVDESEIWGEDHIGTRVKNALLNAEITYLLDLLEHSERDVLKIKNVSRASLVRIKEVLSELGLCLNMQQDGAREELNRRIKAGEVQ